MISIYISKTEGILDNTVDVLAKLDTEFPSVAAATLREIAEILNPTKPPAKVTRERGGPPDYGVVT